MRSLFVKIFFWFWLATAIVGVAFIVSVEATRQEPTGPRWREVATSALALTAQTSAEVYERQGAEALAAFLQRTERNTRMRALLFDGAGKELTGRPPIEGAEGLLDVAPDGAAEFRFSEQGVMTAIGATSSSGQNYVLVTVLPRGQRYNPLRAEPRTWVLRIAIVILLSGMVCYALARYLTAPVVKLRDAAQRLAAGDLDARVGQRIGARGDEIADLGQDFDVMAERIASLLESQRRLLGDISHELRSPLARLNVALGLARRRAGEDAQPALDRIEREAERLNDLIGQLLTLTRLEGGQERRREPIDLARLVEEVAADADFEARSRSRGVRVTASTTCAVEGNEALLRSAIENVVRNAARYTAEGTTVEIDLHCETGNGKPSAVIRVRDHGAGVPAEALADIFRPFYRVADARDRQTGGIGLGLAITERAVHLHGGEVRAANAPDGGLIVELRLPLLNALN